jgi:hypothetical protein
VVVDVRARYDEIKTETNRISENIEKIKGKI